MSSRLTERLYATPRAIIDNAAAMMPNECLRVWRSHERDRQHVLLEGGRCSRLWYQRSRLPSPLRSAPGGNSGRPSARPECRPSTPATNAVLPRAGRRGSSSRRWSSARRRYERSLLGRRADQAPERAVDRGPDHRAASPSSGWRWRARAQVGGLERARRIRSQVAHHRVRFPEEIVLLQRRRHQAVRIHRRVRRARCSCRTIRRCRCARAAGRLAHRPHRLLDVDRRIAPQIASIVSC